MLAELSFCPVVANGLDFQTFTNLKCKVCLSFSAANIPRKHLKSTLVSATSLLNSTGKNHNAIFQLQVRNLFAFHSSLECRKKLPGDICSIIRLHAFLEHWGLINFNVNTHLRPAKISLGNSAQNPKELTEVIQKGYLKLADAERIQAIYKE